LKDAINELQNLKDATDELILLDDADNSSIPYLIGSAFIHYDLVGIVSVVIMGQDLENLPPGKKIGNFPKTFHA
jgi:hypothetical protein